VRRVRVHNVDLLALDDLTEGPGRARVELHGGRDGENRNTERVRSLGERLVGPGRDERAVSEPRQHLRVPEQLALAAAPPAFGIELEYR